MVDSATRTFQNITYGWRELADQALYDVIDRASTYARWPEQLAELEEMKFLLASQFLMRWGVHEIDGHAVFAPSASHEWAHCSGSLAVRMSRGDGAGIDAAMGTVAHSIAEEWNRTGKEPYHLLGKTMSAVAGGTTYSFVIDEEWLANAGMFVQWCAETPGQHYYEQRVDFSSLMPIPEQRGTADFYSVQPGILIVRDLKNGMVRVHAKDNDQLLLYAAAIFLKHDDEYHFEQIILSICHPRLDVYDTWEITRAELLDWMKWISKRALAALPFDAPRTPGEKQCRFCAGRKTCPARVMLLEETVGSMFDAEELPPSKVTFSSRQLTETAQRVAESGMNLPAIKTHPSELSTQALARILRHRKTVGDFFKGVYEELLRRTENGEINDYFELNDGRTTYTWKDESRAIETLEFAFEIPRDKIVTTELKSKSAIETALRAHTKGRLKDIKAFLAPMVRPFAGKRSLVAKASLENGQSADAVGDMFGAIDE